MNHTQPTPPVGRIVMIGGGASGALVATQLARRATAALDVTIVEPRPRLARGLAYSTEDPRHLVNVPARGMSALPDVADHFTRWARCSGVDFATRERYGDYLEAVMRQAWLDAPEGSCLRHLRTRVDAIEGLRAPGLRLRTEEGAWLYAERVVLATGHGAPEVPAWARAVPEVVVAADDPTLLTRLGDPAHVVTVGSGLTAVDVALHVLGAHPRARVTAVSRHGLRPQAHRLPLPDPVALAEIEDGDPSLRELVRAVRRASAAADWRSVIDGLRPRTQELWAGFTEAERQSFVEHLGRFWDIHRHRLAPEVATRVDHYVRSRRLTFVRWPEPGTRVVGNTVTLRLGRDEVPVDAIVPCTGPAASFAATPLGGALLDHGFARPGPLGYGVDCDPFSGALVRADGIVDERLLAIGPLRRGVLWESTAIPELREQAAVVAQRLLGRQTHVVSRVAG